MPHKPPPESFRLDPLEPRVLLSGDGIGGALEHDGWEQQQLDGSSFVVAVIENDVRQATSVETAVASDSGAPPSVDWGGLIEVEPRTSASKERTVVTALAPEKR